VWRLVRSEDEIAGVRVGADDVTQAGQTCRTVTALYHVRVCSLQAWPSLALHCFTLHAKFIKCCGRYMESARSASEMLTINGHTLVYKVRFSTVDDATKLNRQTQSRWFMLSTVNIACVVCNK